jgi:hypothetical protein
MKGHYGQAKRFVAEMDTMGLLVLFAVPGFSHWDSDWHEIRAFWSRHLWNPLYRPRIPPDFHRTARLSDIPRNRRLYPVDGKKRAVDAGLILGGIALICSIGTNVYHLATRSLPFDFSFILIILFLSDLVDIRKPWFEADNQTR